MKIGVIGLGVVGAAVFEGLGRTEHTVTGYDIKHPHTKLEDVLDTDVCFISVPTNTTEDGVCDTSVVESVLRDLRNGGYRGLVTIKSTVLPGTTNALNEKYTDLRLSFCPEFLRERAAYTDFFENHDICVIGAYTEEDGNLIREAHASIPKAFSFLTPLEAEYVKYFSNIFNALRITFANEFYEVCKTTGADYMKIKAAVVKRNNIPDFYLDCHENLRGFGGVCLPKDTKAFATFVKKLGLEHLTLFDTIVKDNQKFRQTVPGGMRASQES